MTALAPVATGRVCGVLLQAVSSNRPAALATRRVTVVSMFVSLAWITSEGML
jgi:hypothetical protein